MDPTNTDPAFLARLHWREGGYFNNPYPANTPEFEEYERVAWELGLDEDFNEKESNS